MHIKFYSNIKSFDTTCWRDREQVKRSRTTRHFDTTSLCKILRH